MNLFEIIKNNQKYVLIVFILIIGVIGILSFQRLCLQKEKSNPKTEDILKGKSFEAASSGNENKIIVKQSSGAGLLISECQDKNYIGVSSDYIIEGTVKKVEAKWAQDQTSIFTHTDIFIEKYIRGTHFSKNTILLIIPGGKVGDIVQLTEDQPIFKEGQKLRIYFKKTNGEFQIVCGNSGIEEI